MIKVLVEECTCSSDHVLVHIVALQNLEKCIDRLKLLTDVAGASCLAHVFEEALKITNTLNSVLNALHKLGIELFAAPLDTVLDCAREVSERAERNRIFFLVLAITIRLRDTRHDHLRVGLCSKSTRLKKRLLIPDALLIHVETSFHVVYSVHDEVERLPELIVEQFLSVWADKSLMCDDLEVRIHHLCLLAGGDSFRAVHIICSEQELPVQVGYLNVIIISDSDESVLPAAKSHQSHSLDEFTAKSTSSYHESLDVSKLLLNFTTINFDLVIVATALRLSVCLSSGERVEVVDVHPLLQRHVFTREFDDFLS